MLPSGRAVANAPLASQLTLASALHVDQTRAPSTDLLFMLKWEEAAGLTGSLSEAEPAEEALGRGQLVEVELGIEEDGCLLTSAGRDLLHWTQCISFFFMLICDWP